MNYYVTYLDEKYLQHAEKLFELLKIYSKYKIIAYTVNFNYVSEFENVITVYFDKKNNTFIDNMFLKPEICQDVLFKNPLDNFCYIDADILPLPNCDEIFEIQKINNYPLFTRQCHDYIFFHNMDVDENYEKNLFKYLNLDYKKRTYVYKHACAFVFNEKCKEIMNQWVDISKNEYLRKNYKTYCPSYDEILINVLLWHNDYNDYLGRIHIDLPDFKNKNIFDFFYALCIPKNEEYLYDSFTRIPRLNEFNKVKFLHGKLNEVEYEVLKSYIELNFIKK
jgi:hypothetical protein